MKVSHDDRIYFIKKTAWLHNTLFEALKEINSIFSIEVKDFQFNFLIKSNYFLKIVFVVLTTLISQVFSTFYLIQTLKNGVFSDAIIKGLIDTVLWLIWQTIPVGLAIHYASKTTEFVSILINYTST